MKRINNKILILVLFCLCCSCSSAGNRKTIELYNSKIDKQSIDDIAGKYGSFNRKWEDNEGNTIYNYIYTKGYYTFPVYFPIMMYFGSIVSDNYEVLLVYNKKGQLTEKKDFYSRVKSSTNATCSRWSKSCIKKVYEK